MLILGAGSSLSYLALTASPDTLSSLSIPYFENSRVKRTAFWITLQEGFAAKSIRVVRIWILITMINAVFNKCCSRVASMHSKCTRRGVPFFSAASPSLRPHTQFTTKVISSRMMLTVSVNVLIGEVIFSAADIVALHLN